MKHKIIIEVKDGLVQAVYSTNADDEVEIHDLDCMSLPANCQSVPKAMQQIY